jgi:hypothetical protein
MSPPSAADRRKEEAVHAACPSWLRAYVAFVALQAGTLGLSTFLAPQAALTSRLFPLQVSPLNARVIGAFYLGGTIGLILTLWAQRAVDARIMVIGAGMITGMLLVMTFAYWDEFTVDHIPYGWIGAYIIDPVVAVIAVVKLRLVGPAVAGWHRLTPILILVGAAFALTGLVLLVAPGFAVDHWPWKLTPVLARVYASLFLVFGTAGLLAAWERRAAAIRPYVAGMAALAVLVLIASLRHRDRFHHGTREDFWFACFIVGALLFAGGLFMLVLAAAKGAGGDVPASGQAAALPGSGR